MSATWEDYIEKYQKWGWSFFPVGQDKKPIISEWAPFQKKVPTTEEIADWKTRFGEFNIGVVTGKISGITVIDLDVKYDKKNNEIANGIKTLETAPFSLPPTYTVQTPSGGQHRIFLYNEHAKQTVKIYQGIDVRNDGGYIVAPPSKILIDKAQGEKIYKILHAIPFAALPENLFAVRPTPTQTKELHWVAQQLQDGIKEGYRDDTLFRIACHFRAKNLPQNETEQLLLLMGDKCEPPFPSQIVLEKVSQAYKYPIDPKYISIQETPEIKQMGDSLEFTWGRHGVKVIVDNIFSHYEGMYCEMEVFAEPLGQEPARYGPTRVNLHSTRGRSEMIKALGELVQMDWKRMIDAICRLTLAKSRQGEEAVRTSDVQIVSAEWALPPLVMDKEISILFGDGGTGKSYLSLAIMLTLQHENILGITPSKKYTGMYLDWESNASTFTNRANRLCVPYNIQHNLWYQRCIMPLSELQKQLRKSIAEKGVDFIIIDSAAQACGGEPETSVSANEFFRALRSLNCTALVIAHQTKNGTKQHKPFGSVFWSNNPRSTIEIQKVQEEGKGISRVSLFHRKINDDILFKPISFLITHTADQTTIAPTEFSYEDFEDERPLKKILYEYLGEESQLTKDIAQGLGKSEGAIRKTLSRNKDLFQKDGNMWQIKQNYWNKE